MRGKHVLRLGFCGVLGAVAYSWLAFGQEDGKPPGWKMREGMLVTACLACHPGEKVLPKLADSARCCDQNCVRCHPGMDKHHPVGAGVTEKSKVSLPLLGNDKVSCVSCHDALSATTDTHSWKSQSLFSKWFQGQKVYKTYFLRINNSDGKLCKSCH